MLYNCSINYLPFIEFSYRLSNIPHKLDRKTKYKHKHALFTFSVIIISVYFQRNKLCISMVYLYLFSIHNNILSIYVWNMKYLIYFYFFQCYILYILFFLQNLWMKFKKETRKLFVLYKKYFCIKFSY